MGRNGGKIQLDMYRIILYSQNTNLGICACVLGEQEGKRRLPIMMVVSKLQAIANRVRKKDDANSPLTHDLFKKLADVFEFPSKK